MKQTRAARARILLQRLTRGPMLSTTAGTPFTPEEAIRRYQNWVQSWVLEDLVNLIPELRADEKEKQEKQKAWEEAARMQAARPAAPEQCPSCSSFEKGRRPFTHRRADGGTEPCRDRWHAEVR